jgi:hypothetical protein
MSTEKKDVVGENPLQAVRESIALNGKYSPETKRAVENYVGYIKSLKEKEVLIKMKKGEILNLRQLLGPDWSRVMHGHKLQGEK